MNILSTFEQQEQRRVDHQKAVERMTRCLADGVESLDTWLVVAEDDGPDGNGRVLGYFTVDSEEEGDSMRNRRGEICDLFELYLGEDIADDFVLEITTYGEFINDYGNRMSLRNYKKW